MTHPEPQDPDLEQLRALRMRQQREAARGCLIILVLEGAALLGAVLWLVAAGLGMPRLSSAAGFAFIAFTLAATLAGLAFLVQGNLPAQRRLRRDYDRRIREGAPEQQQQEQPTGRDA